MKATKTNYNFAWIVSWGSSIRGALSTFDNVNVMISCSLALIAAACNKSFEWKTFLISISGQQPKQQRQQQRNLSVDLFALSNIDSFTRRIANYFCFQSMKNRSERMRNWLLSNRRRAERWINDREPFGTKQLSYRCCNSRRIICSVNACVFRWSASNTYLTWSATAMLKSDTMLDWRWCPDERMPKHWQPDRLQLVPCASNDTASNGLNQRMAATWWVSRAVQWCQRPVRIGGGDSFHWSSMSDICSQSNETETHLIHHVPIVAVQHAFANLVLAAQRRPQLWPNRWINRPCILTNR